MNDATCPAIGVDFRIDPKRHPLRLRLETEMSKRESLNSCTDAEGKSRKADEAGRTGNVRDAHAPHNVGSRPLGPLPNNVLVGAVQMELIQSDTLPERR